MSPFASPPNGGNPEVKDQGLKDELENQILRDGTLAIIGSAFVSSAKIVEEAVNLFALKPHTVIGEPVWRSSKSGVGYATEKWFDMQPPDSMRLCTISSSGNHGGIFNASRNRRVAKKAGHLLILLGRDTPMTAEFVDAIIAARWHRCQVYVYRSTAGYNA